MEKSINAIWGVVRSLDGHDAIVETTQQGCGRCHEKGGCGGQNLTQMFCSGAKTYRVANPAGAEVGEKVVIAIAVGSVRHSANLAYAFPLAGLLGGAFLGVELAGDLGAMVGGGVGLVTSWLTISRKLGYGTGNKELHPHIISRSQS